MSEPQHPSVKKVVASSGVCIPLESDPDCVGRNIEEPPQYQPHAMHVIEDRQASPRHTAQGQTRGSLVRPGVLGREASTQGAKKKNAAA